MLSIRMRDAHLLVNEIKIVDLRKPFLRIIQKSDGISGILRKPSETLVRPRKPLSYYVKITGTKAGALYNVEKHGLQSHWVYSTNNTISNVFKDKSLQTILKNLDSELEQFELIRQYLSVAVNFLVKSFDFDVILTSIPTLGSITKFNLVVDEVKLTKLPDLSYEPRRYRSVKALLKGHKEGLPTRLFDWEILTNITAKHTTLDRKALEGYNNILVLAGTNVQYAGFLAREVAKIRGVKEVLPVSLFHVGGRP
jgi:hypothetical protein